TPIRPIDEPRPADEVNFVDEQARSVGLREQVDALEPRRRHRAHGAGPPEGRPALLTDVGHVEVAVLVYLEAAVEPEVDERWIALHVQDPVEVGAILGAVEQAVVGHGPDQLVEGGVDGAGGPAYEVQVGRMRSPGKLTSDPGDLGK